jgi:hypothetical protein
MPFPAFGGERHNLFHSIYDNLTTAFPSTHINRQLIENRRHPIANGLPQVWVLLLNQRTQLAYCTASKTAIQNLICGINGLRKSLVLFI